MHTASEKDLHSHRERHGWRKYDISYLDGHGKIAEISRRAPALPAFEDCFGALGHGAIIQTATGPMAAEDLLPGDQVKTADGMLETLLWRGSITIMPDPDGAAGANSTLVRVTSDALGPQRPAADLVLGPAARLHHRSAGARTLTGSQSAFVPARDFVDGSHFVDLRPVAPVRVYQLGFARHEKITVNGVAVESLHPGTFFTLGLKGDLLTQFLSLFPHKEDLSDFGTLRHPRLRMRDLDLVAMR
ncbi:Hint domain-containing protein [Yoonia sediminilitoris]|uniref:Hint domain-containing protein n=1 Tax=Yoonia sediminilitoris TaxID=1286148 RepID=UPI001455756F|nr:Hint domain-containing protein [Yoonia sediminilitoris]